MEKPIEGEAVGEIREGCEMTVIRSPVHSTFHTMTEGVLWLETIHLNLVVLFLAFLFSSSSTMILLLIGFIVLLMVGPVDEESRLGKAIVRFLARAALFRKSEVSKNLGIFENQKTERLSDFLQIDDH